MYICVYLSELSAGLAACIGWAALQKSSTVNFPSFLSTPYIAITLPERDAVTSEIHDYSYILVVQFFLIWPFKVSSSTTMLTCDTLVSVNFALQFDSLKLILQDQLICLTDIFLSCWLRKQVVLKEMKKTDALNNTCQLFNFSLTLKTFFKKGFESILKLNHFSPKPRFPKQTMLFC